LGAASHCSVLSGVTAEATLSPSSPFRHLPSPWLLATCPGGQTCPPPPLGPSRLSPQAFSFIIALIVSQYSLYGYDGVAHLAEETKQSDRTGPMAIMASISTISLLGWGLIVSATFSIQDIDHLIVEQPNAPGAPYLQIIWDVFYNNTRWGRLPPPPSFFSH